MKLTARQIEIIREQLLSSQLKYKPLQEELLDHLCCLVEEEMYKGATFLKALSSLSEIFQEDEIQSIEKETLSLLNSKSDLMKKLSLLTLFCLLLTFTFVWGKKTEAQEKLANLTPPEIAPIENFAKISSGFGMRFHPIYKIKKMHTGIDIPAKIGTPVLATSDGEVFKVEKKETGYGNNITIEHDCIFKTIYAQLSIINVKEGQQIKKGTIIGAVGNSGASTAPHLHYEVIKEGEKVNPELYFMQ